MEQDLILMNFRMRRDMKETFELICRSKNIAMTSQLNMLIEKYNREEMTKNYLKWKIEPEEEPLSFLSTNMDTKTW